MFILIFFIESICYIGLSDLIFMIAIRFSFFVILAKLLEFIKKGI